MKPTDNSLQNTQTTITAIQVIKKYSYIFTSFSISCWSNSCIMGGSSRWI